MGKPLRLALTILVAVAAVVGLLLFVQSRDRSTFNGDTGASGAGAPGRLLPDQGDEHRAPPASFKYATAPPASGPHRPVPIRAEAPLSRDQVLHGLESGDVVLFYNDPADEPKLRAIAEDISGPFDATLARAGQAVLVEHRPHTKGVIALAWRRMLTTASAGDSRLHAFAEAWLGHGASG